MPKQPNGEAASAILAPSNVSRPWRPFQRVPYRAGQSPHQTRGSVVKPDLTAHGPPRHRVDDRGAEAPPLRRRHGRSVTFSPAHGEDIAIKPPAHVDTADVHRQRAVFAGIGNSRPGQINADGFAFARIPDGMMISTTLRRSAIHAVDHLPDLELGPCGVAAAHRWDHPEDRAAARQVDRGQVAPADRAEGPDRASAHSDFGPQKYSFLFL